MESIDRDKRRYIRLNTVFPVEFQLVDEDKEPISRMFQGFTRDVGKGGMCIETRAVSSKDIFSFIPDKTRVKLIIDIPSSMVATESYGTVSWTEKPSARTLNTYIFGVEYDEIGTRSQKVIYLYVLWLHRRPKLVFVFFLLLLIIAVVLTYLGVKPT